VPLGTASAFSVLAGSTITNTGTTSVDRSIGVHPGTAVTGADTMVIGGTTHAGDAVALQAKTDLTNAYNDAAGQTPPIAADPELGGETLVGGVYNRAAEMALTGVLTLDGQDDPDSVWVFQAGTTLTTASASSVVLIRGANPCNVFWQVGSSATLGTTTTFVGTVMANASIGMQTGATLNGRVLARTGAVTLDSNVITSPGCAYDREVPDAVDTGTGGGTTGGTTGGTDGTGDTGNGGTGGAGGTGTGTTNGSTDTVDQVTTIPTGAVDTGYAGPADSANRAPGALVSSSAFLALAGGLALVAVRRRRV
jgi:hypothetical protein